MSTKPKHIPLRRCVVCRDSKPQADLLRFVKGGEDQWQFDSSYALHKRKSNGRGAWVCKDSSCHKEKVLKRVFREDAEPVFKALAEQREQTPNQSSGVAPSHTKSSATRSRVTDNGGMNV